MSSHGVRVGLRFARRKYVAHVTNRTPRQSEKLTSAPRVVVAGDKFKIPPQSPCTGA